MCEISLISEMLLSWLPVFAMSNYSVFVSWPVKNINVRHIFWSHRMGHFRINKWTDHYYFVKFIYLFRHQRHRSFDSLWWVVGEQVKAVNTGVCTALTTRQVQINVHSYMFGLGLGLRLYVLQVNGREMNHWSRIACFSVDSILITSFTF